jgi:ureidoacrylate peracid hydrolase
MSSVPVSRLDEWIAPGRCALLIVDMQVDFASVDGVLGRAGLDLTGVTDALERARELAAAARVAGVKIVFVGLLTSPDTDSPVWVERSRRLGEDVGDGLCRLGSAGAAFVGPAPIAGDLVIFKTRYSAFHDGDLDLRLRNCGLDTLIICGLTTECCVDATARDAYQRDFHTFIAADACAAYDPDVHVAALRSLALNCAILATSEMIVQAWRCPPQA